MRKSPFLIKRFIQTYATLYLDVATDELIQDGNNWVPATQSIEAIAYLKQTTKEAKQIAQPGVNVSQVHVKGYLVSPMHFPNGVRPTQCKVKLGKREATLEFLPVADKPFSTERYTGDYIEGWLGWRE